MEPGFIGADSTVADSIGADAAGADSIEADFIGADSPGAGSAGADSAGADSIGANFAGADSAVADSIVPGSSGADFTGASVFVGGSFGFNLSELQNLTVLAGGLLDVLLSWSSFLLFLSILLVSWSSVSFCSFFTEIILCRYYTINFLL